MQLRALFVFSVFYFGVRMMHYAATLPTASQMEVEAQADWAACAALCCCSGETANRSRGAVSKQHDGRSWRACFSNVGLE